VILRRAFLLSGLTPAAVRIAVPAG
jgi:hypothetical protein